MLQEGRILRIEDGDRTTDLIRTLRALRIRGGDLGRVHGSSDDLAKEEGDDTSEEGLISDHS